MHLIRTFLALAALMALSMSSVGQDTEAPEEEAAPPPAPDTRPLDEIFIPSEEIAADEEVTFPVNI